MSKNEDAKLLKQQLSIFIAAWEGNLDVVRSLVKQGVRADATRDTQGTQPIHLAALKGHLDIVKYFVEECGVKADAKNTEGAQAIHGAAHGGHLDIVKYFVEECGADINAAGTDGHQAIHVAANLGNLSIVEYLIKRGANPKSQLARNPLEAAFKSNQYLRHTPLFLSCSRFSGKEIQANTIRHLLSIWLDSEDLRGKIRLIGDLVSSDEIKSALNDQNWKKTSGQVDELLKIFREEFVKSLIPANLTQRLDSRIFPKSFFAPPNRRSRFSSPCDTFNVVAEIRSDGGDAFQGSTLPSQKPSRKTVILDSHSFKKGGNRLSLEQKKTVIRSLNKSGFNTYLFVKNEATDEGEFKYLNDFFNGDEEKDGLDEALKDKAISQFTLDENLLAKLSKLNPSISIDSLINPDLEQLFAVSALSYVSSFNDDGSERDDLFSKLSEEEFNITQRILSKDESPSSNRDLYLLLGLVTIVAIGIYFYRNIPQSQPLPPATNVDPEDTSEALVESIQSYALQKASQSSLSKFLPKKLETFLTIGLAKLGEMAYDNITKINDAFATPETSFNITLPTLRRDKKKVFVAKNSAQQYAIDDQATHSTFEMENVGEVLNRNIENLYARTAAKEFVIDENGEIFFREKTPTSFEEVSFNKIGSQEIDSYKRSQNDTYIKFSTELKADQRMRLFSADAEESLVGLMGDLEDLKIEKGNDGFLYATSSKNMSLPYVLKVESQTAVKELLPEVNPLQAIIDDYRNRTKGFSESTAEDFVLPKIEDGNSTKWLEEVYEARSGECRLRVAAVYHKIAQEHPEQLENVRIIGINNNHDILEIRAGENEPWVQADLGGAQAELNYEPEIPAAEDAPESWFGELNWRQIFSTSLVTLDFLYRVRKLQKAEALDPKEDTKEDVDEKIGQEEKKKIEGVVRQKTKDLLQKRSKFEEVNNPEDVFEKTLRNQRTLLATKHLNNSANFFIKKFSDAGKKVFYLDSPQKIFLERGLDVRSKEEVAIIDADLFTKFIGNLAGRDCAIIINWAAFSSNQILALNTLLDKDCRVGGVRIENPAIISLVGGIPTDPSFLSRHQLRMISSSDFAMNDLENSSNQKEPIVVDLEGVIDWRQKLFGFIKLSGDKIIWDKSGFCDDLERGEKHFKIKNISPKARKEFEREIAEARSAGFIDYNGHLIELSTDVKFSFEEKSFNFTRFNEAEKIRVKEGATYSAELPKDVKLINTHLFDHLLKRNSIDEEKRYVEIEGFIKDSSDGELNLFITSRLSKQQYCCLFNGALKNNVTLNLYLAEGVDLPKEVTFGKVPDIAPEQKIGEKVLSEKPKIIVTNDPTQTLQIISAQGDAYAVIDTEDYGYKQLFEDIKFDRTKGGYENFREVFSQFAQRLMDGEKIILKGEIPEHLLLTIQPILCHNHPEYAAIRDNLIILVEDKGIKKDQKKYQALEFLGAGGYSIEHYDLSTQKPKSSSLDFFEDTPEDAEVDLTNSVEEAAEFIRQRKENFTRLLHENSIVQMVGHSGVGKSQLLDIMSDEEDYEVCYEMTNFDEWTQDSDTVKILFIDESNTEDSHLTKFSPLKSFDYSKEKEGVIDSNEIEILFEDSDERKEQTVRILHDEKFYKLGKNCKLVCARNPTNYSSGRVSQKLFDDGVPVMYFRDFPPSYIYEDILKKPIYDQLSAEVKEKISEETFKEKCKELITEYQKFNKEKRHSGDDVHCQTVRELQEDVLTFLKKDIQPEQEEIELRNIRFISTSATAEIERSLIDSLEIRKLQRNGTFGRASAGLNGFIIEGDPGVGKSELIKAAFESKGIFEGDLEGISENDGSLKYYKITAKMSFEQKKEIIVRAYEEENVIWFDELNSCINEAGLEKALNAAMTGHHPEGKNDGKVRAGLMMVSSINSALLEGRSSLSPAIKHRSILHQAKSLRDYELEDLQKITQHCIEEDSGSRSLEYDTKNVAEVVASILSGELASEESSLSLRDLSDIVPEIITELTKSPSSSLITSNHTPFLDLKAESQSILI